MREIVVHISRELMDKICDDCVCPAIPCAKCPLHFLAGEGKQVLIKEVE